MCPHVPFQLISVSAGIAAQTALEGSFSCMRADVPFQLTYLQQGDKNKTCLTSTLGLVSTGIYVTTYLHTGIVTH